MRALGVAVNGASGSYLAALSVAVRSHRFDSLMRLDLPEVVRQTRDDFEANIAAAGIDTRAESAF